MTRKGNRLKCAVWGCNDKTERIQRFPHPRSDGYKRFWSWLALCGNENLLSQHPLDIYDRRRLCTNHFADSDYAVCSNRRKLKKNAMPSINLPPPLLTPHPQQGEFCAPSMATAIKVEGGGNPVVDIPEPSSGVHLMENQTSVTTGQLLGLGDNVIAESSTTSAQLYASLFGSIPKVFPNNESATSTLGMEPVLVAPVCEMSGPQQSLTEPMAIDIVVPAPAKNVVPEIPPNVSSSASVSPAQRGRNVPGSETSGSTTTVSTCASDSAVIHDSGVKCLDEINRGTVVRPCGTPAEKTVESSSLAKWREDIRDAVANSADDHHLFSIPGSDFAHDAQVEGVENVVDRDSTPDEHVGITEPDAGDDDSSRDSIFSHYIAGASPPPEKTRTIDGVAVELLAKTLLAGYADVSVVPVSDPYYRYKLCRLCFRAGKEMTMIFGGVFTDYSLKDAIEDMIRFQVSASDDYPQGVCEHCLSKLTKFKRFKEQFREAKEFFDQELRRNNKTVDEGGGLTSNKVVMGQPVVTSADGEAGVLSDREHSVQVDVPTTSRKDEHQWQVNAEGEQPDHDMSAHEDFNDDTDLSSEEDFGKTEGEDFPVHEEMERPQVKPPRRMPSDEDKFACRTCGAEFMYKNHWKDHVREHEKGYPFPCTYCDRRYKDLQTLNSHIITHSDYKPYECELCSKRFRRPQDLLFHKNNHIGLRQHLCADCGKAFAGLAGLRRHERMHRKKRHFICNVCHREFSTNHGLKSHMEVHQKDEMFTCQLCSKQYASRRKLVKHLNYMHGPKREFPCDVCNKVFACKENLSHHRRRHFGLPPRIRKPRVPVK
ncbi:uncharacterized protein LOC124170157 [Ischnura elegans]|uniref:uncharacterized protein LOC124170157 n=1 Tax=Ischnura elegans TaxID=197161 RepID=UPI001ED89B82|nr:uncharacterized protein LOC124170157 [Ischnura elegans]